MGHLLLVGPRQSVVVLVQYRLQFGPGRNNNVIARLLLLEVNDPLPAFQRTDIALVDGRVVPEPLRRITTDQKYIAGNIFVLVVGRISNRYHRKRAI